MDRERFIDGLMKSDIAKKILGNEKKQALELRRRLVLELAEAEQKIEKEMPSLNDAVTAAEKNREVARESLRQSEAEYWKVFYDRHNVSLQFDAKRASLEGQLRALAPACISIFVTELKQEWEATRRVNPESYRERDTLNAILDIVRGPRYSSYPSINRRLTAIQEASKRAEDLALQPLSEEETQSRIEEIRASLPGIIMELVKAA